MKVRVKDEKWGRYKKGDLVEIENESTALACIKAGAVESTEVKANEPKKPKTAKSK